MAETREELIAAVIDTAEGIPLVMDGQTGSHRGATALEIDMRDALFEDLAVLREARRLIRAVKEQVGEHGDPEDEGVQAWLDQTGAWLTDCKALVDERDSTDENA
jgi:hypothetical protein